MTIRLISASLTDKGVTRDHNEDYVYDQVFQSSMGEPLGLFIVADGMGGHAAGEKASELAVKTIEREFSGLFTPRDPLATRKLSETEIQQSLASGVAPTRKLSETVQEEQVRGAVQRANAVVLDFARHKPEAADTGTTVTMALIQGSSAYIANVGDSRTYLFRDNQLERVTTDHSLVMSLVAAGKLQIEEIYDHPQRNVIYRCLGDKPNVQVDTFRRELLANDVLLFCSDGLWEMVRDGDIAAILRANPDPAAACRKLIDAANKGGGEDNIGVVVVKVR